MNLESRILYEDNHIIAINKWAGALVHASDPKETSVMDSVKQFIKERDKKEGNVFIGLVHRLDRAVSGIVLFGKTSKGASRLSEQFREHTVTKQYHAWVQGELKQSSGNVVVYLKKDEQRHVARIVDEGVRGGQRSELSYKVVKTDTYQGKKVSLVHVDLKTGRYNQIRATFAHLGHPILGDSKYGSTMPYHDGVALRSTYCKFKKATSEEWVELKLPTPEL